MRSFAAAIVIGLVLAIPIIGQAQVHDGARTAVEAGEARPLGDLLEGLSGRFPGRLLDAQLVQGIGAPLVYALRILGDDGQVRIVSVDARTGQVLSVQGGR